MTWFPAEKSAHASAEAPGEISRRAIVAWAEARGLVVTLPRTGTSSSIAIDLTRGDEIEKELANAHDALTRLDADAAEHALSRARSIARAHPELPHAAWLLAEIERGWAARWMRIEPTDPARAARAWQIAATLDGGRAPGIGETGAPRPAHVAATFEFDTDPDFHVRVDGMPITPGPGKFAPGEHAVVAERGDHIVWADWVSISPGAVVVVPSFGPIACTTGDLARASGDREGIDASGVVCEKWIAAVPAGSSSVRVAVCERDACGPFVTWQMHNGPLGPILPPRTHESKTPLWIGVTAVGVVAVIAATSIALLATGAFEPAPHETKFVGSGVKTAGD
ncbi:MAG: hypothetical protein ACRELY_07745 [Polyangiaceae bacterium]